MEGNTIRFVAVFPRSKTRCRYSINDNVSELHTLDYEEMYRFLCRFVSPPVTQEVREFLQTFQRFFVDVENQAVYKLELDLNAEAERLREEMRSVTTRGASREMRRREAEEKASKQKTYDTSLWQLFRNVLK